jgi:hypothetical protein
MKFKKSFILFLFATVFSSSVVAQIQYLECTYLLERWKINDLEGKAGCPFGEDGLGKQWLVETYSFDLKKGTVSDASITKNYCYGGVTIVYPKLSIQPDKLIFTEQIKDEGLIKLYGTQRISSIDRRTLKTNNGVQCKILQNLTTKI